jgi:hypothetical protein
MYLEPVYDDCDVPLKVLAAHLVSGSAVIADNFAVTEDGSLVRAGNAENSDAEEETDIAPLDLGRGKRQRIATRRFQGAMWEEH